MGKLCQCGVLSLFLYHLELILGKVSPVDGEQRLDLEVVALQVTQMGGLGLSHTQANVAVTRS